MAITSLVTESTRERQRRWARDERRRPMRLAGSAVTTCVECGERFPDTSGGHWPGQCLLVLRRTLRRLEKDMALTHVDDLRALAAGVARRSVIRDRIRRLLRQIGDHETDGIKGIRFTPASLGVRPEELP